MGVMEREILTPEQVDEIFKNHVERLRESQFLDLIHTIKKLRKQLDEAEIVNCNECATTIPLIAAHVLCDKCLHSYIDN